MRHPELRPTAVRLYARMRKWLAEGIEAGRRAGAFDAGADPERVADRLMALADGYGVRVLIGELEIERARAEIWDALAGDLGLPGEAPPLDRAARAR